MTANIWLRCDTCDRLLDVEKGDAFFTDGEVYCNDDYPYPQEDR